MLLRCIQMRRQLKRPLFGIYYEVTLDFSVLRREKKWVKHQDDRSVGRANLTRRELWVSDSSTAPGWEISVFHALKQRWEAVTAHDYHGVMYCITYTGIGVLLPSADKAAGHWTTGAWRNRAGTQRVYTGIFIALITVVLELCGLF